MRNRPRIRARKDSTSSQTPRVISVVRSVEGSEPGALFVTPAGDLHIRYQHRDMGCRQVNRLTDPMPVYISDDGRLWQGQRILVALEGSGDE